MYKYSWAVRPSAYEQRTCTNMERSPLRPLRRRRSNERDRHWIPKQRQLAMDWRVSRSGFGSRLVQPASVRASSVGSRPPLFGASHTLGSIADCGSHLTAHCLCSLLGARRKRPMGQQVLALRNDIPLAQLPPSCARGALLLLAIRSNRPPTQVHAPNPGMTSLFHAGRQWRGVGDPWRSFHSNPCPSAFIRG
jgi:hypothetical protein